MPAKSASAWALDAAVVGDAVAAEILYERLAPFASRGVTTGATVTGTVDMFLGPLATLLGRHDAAEAHFERADAQLGELGARFALARNQVEWARMLIARGGAGDFERATALIAEATATAEQYGFAWVQRRAAESAATLP